MSKVTSKLQITIPKAIADRYSIAPGDELEWELAAESVRIVPARRKLQLDAAARVRLFDAATKRQRAREAEAPRPEAAAAGRGWTREELYDRDRSR